MALASIKKPDKQCDDPKCPFHGSLSIRGRILEGTVISAKMNGTVIVQRDYLKYVPKYRRYERRRSHIPAHNPPCVDATGNSRVKIAECRPVSKTVSFVVVEKVET
jgi:small subunit ribosomal protein S17